MEESIREVEHPVLGKGKILKTRWKNQEFLIQFDRGFLTWVPKNALKIKEKERQKVKLPTLQSIKPYKGDISQRKMIEAFRLGIVPQGEVKNFTFGRDKEIEKLKEGFERLDKNGGSVLTIEGEYGGGKTHFLDYIYITALENGYAVARAELDPIDVTPYNPKSIYRELIGSFKFNDGDFREFLKKASKLDTIEEHRFLSPVLEKLKNDGDMEESLWKWICAEPQPRWYLNKFKELRTLPLLPDFSTSADNYCYLLSGIAYLSKKIGLKGFVILIDEAETLFHLWWKTISLERGVNLFKGLVLTTLGEVPTTITDNLRKDEYLNAWVEDIGDYKLIHRGVESGMTPYLYKKPSNIFLVLAFTPRVLSAYRDILDTIGNRGINTILLRLTLSDFKEMFERLSIIYQSAFPERKFRDAEKNYIFYKTKKFCEEGIRPFIKAVIESFDLLRHYPEESIDELLK